MELAKVPGGTMQTAFGKVLKSTLANSPLVCRMARSSQQLLFHFKNWAQRLRWNYQEQEQQQRLPEVELQ